MNRIAVLITVHNRKSKTINCLRHLYEQKLPNSCQISVFLTDDGCTDGTPDEVINKFPEVNIIHGDGTLYWNRGMIAAWQEASKTNPDFYLWLNDDTSLKQDALTVLLNISEKNSNRTIVVGATSSSLNPTQTTYSGRDKHQSIIIPKEFPQYCTTFNGNIVLIPKYVYNILGFNDPIFHHSLGDYDYGYRATKNDIPIILAPKHLGECEQHASIAKWRDSSLPFFYRWKHFMSPLGANPFEFFRFNNRHFGIIKACVLFCSNFIHLLMPGLWLHNKSNIS